MTRPFVDISPPSRYWDPRLYWTAVGDGAGATLDEFPDLGRLTTRASVVAGNLSLSAYSDGAISLRLKEFADAVGRATDRLLIVDPYFGKNSGPDRSTGHFVVAASLAASKVNLVRVISGRLQGAEIRAAKQLLVSARNKPTHGRRHGVIEWLDRLPGGGFDIHDRFAIVDSELWHFGADVGGAHPGLTMTSGPWSAGDSWARSFFEELWRRLGGAP